MLVEALSHATLVYLGIAAGFGLLTLGAWAGLSAFAAVRRLLAEKGI